MCNMQSIQAPAVFWDSTMKNWINAPMQINTSHLIDWAQYHVLFIARGAVTPKSFKILKGLQAVVDGIDGERCDCE